jgi:predicted CoA-substrate-specific enzyme activase
MSTLVALGVDAGSTTAKIVGVDADGDLAWHQLEVTEPLMEAQASRLIAAAWERAGSRVPVVATGYGRKLVGEASRAVTEITCHGRGVFRAVGHGGSLIDIGGQDSKVIAIGDDGAVSNFGMNDRCAAGTGRFLEVISDRLQVDLDTLAAMALAASDEVAISSTCTVFAESEIISMMARGTPLPAISRGLHRALARRVVSLARQLGVRAPVMLSGGVAHNEAMRVLLGEELGVEVMVPRHPQLMGAYGAALVARRQAK